MGRVDGKIAFVTGGAQGLGQAIALMLAREGAKVVIADIKDERAQAVAAEINANGPERALALHLNVTDEAGWQEALARAAGAFGGLHILVNNAGIGITKTIEDTSFEEWRRVHAVDLDSVFLGCKYAIPHLRDSGGGAIVNISSVSGIIAAHNLAAYNSAKAGVRHLTKSVALYCARQRSNIRCNSVHPTFINTPILQGMMRHLGSDEALAKLGRQVPVGHIGEPDDVAYAVLYLASDEAKFVTGAELVVDGGITAM